MVLNNSQKHVKKNNTNRTVSIIMFLCAAVLPKTFHKGGKSCNPEQVRVLKKATCRGIKKPFHFERVHTIDLLRLI